MQATNITRVFLAFLILSNLLQIPAAGQAPQGGLRITIVEGDGAINNVRGRVSRDPIVQVEDDNRRPIGGAIVTFFLPDQGASGTFVNGARTLTVTTDAQGRATAVGIRPNNISGQMQIRVTASFQGQTASAVITQTNTLGAAAGSSAATTGLSTAAKIGIILGAVGAAAVIGTVVATRNGSSTPTPTPGVTITLTPGAPTVR
jgi:hypothetical protein